MIKGFEFQDGGRQYSCSVEAMSGPEAEQWWGFAVSGDQQRYAPFRAEKGDTRTSVQERVVAFYMNRLFQLAQPRERGGHFGSRKRPVTATPAAAEAAKPEA